MGGRHGCGRLTPALLAGGAALAVAQGGPGLTALAPVRRLFPRLADAGQPDHVALTFDDGPDPRFTPRLLAILDARRVQATFFLLGPMVQAAPGLAAEIASAGHEIAVHGWEHRYATVRPPWARCPGCWTSAAAAGRGQAGSPSIWRTVPSLGNHSRLRDSPRSSGEVKAVVCGK
jgi:Polysaccharide deacetylase